MEKIAKVFTNPRYLYITRHPYNVIESMMRMQANLFPRSENNLMMAEELWMQTNTNVHAFLSGVPHERWHQLSYEDLMRSPEATLKSFTSFLGHCYEPAMANPYQGNRLMKGIGCVNLPKRRKVEPELADAWKSIRGERALLPDTMALAAQLGY